jgi:hypothetical protein
MDLIPHFVLYRTCNGPFVEISRAGFASAEGSGWRLLLWGNLAIQMFDYKRPYCHHRGNKTHSPSSFKKSPEI